MFRDLLSALIGTVACFMFWRTMSLDDLEKRAERMRYSTFLMLIAIWVVL